MFKRKLWFPIFLFIGVALVLVNCKKPVPKTGFTDKTINIAQWGPQSGPAALWGAVARGTACYFKLINSEGGINGRKINYFLRDDAYQPSRTKAEVRKLVEGEGIFSFVGGVGTSTGLAVKRYLEENKVPWVSPVAGSIHWTVPMSKYVFSIYPLYSNEAATLVNYSIETLKKKKIAIFYQNDDYGKYALHGAEMELEKRGMKLIKKVSVEIMDTDLSSQALKLKESGAETVLMWVLPKQASIILGATEKIGYKPQWMTSTTLSDMAIMYKITRGRWKGMIYASFVELPDSMSPLMVKYRNAHKKFAPHDRWGTFFYAGFLFAQPLVAALKNCGRDLSTEKFIKEMEKLKNLKTIGGDVTFGPKKRQGTTTIFLSQCLSKTKAKKLTGWVSANIDQKELIKRLKQ
ncbi:ABC transporter substrate-binding protein [Spirochaetota bacterium]